MPQIIVTADRGVKGGYRLGRAPSQISLLDIVLAIDGSQPAFRCTEIRQRGPCAAAPSACRSACAIARALVSGFNPSGNACKACRAGAPLFGYARSPRDPSRDASSTGCARCSHDACAAVLSLSNTFEPGRTGA